MAIFNSFLFVDQRVEMDENWGYPHDLGKPMETSTWIHFQLLQPAVEPLKPFGESQTNRE